ncbi:MAG: VCBS repeat-containing protein, partial [Planctomycetota bacterium]
EPGSMIAAAGLKQSLELAGPEEFEAVLIEYMTRLNESQNLAYKIGSSERPAGHLAKPMGAAMNAMGRPVESVAWQESLLLASPSGSEQLARKFSDLKSQLRERFQTGLDAERSPAAKLSKRLRPGFLAKSLALIERSSASGLASASERPVNQRQAAVPSFTDVARQVGIQFRYENASPILEKEFRLFEALGGGVACFDFDLDGRVDFYLGQAGLNPPAEPASDVPSNSLYRQVDQSFNDSTAVSGLATADYTLGVTAGDWNGDGFPDLFVGNVGDNRLWLNQGDGTFRFAKPIPEQGAESMVTASVAIADVNGDGIADLIEANYVDDDRVYDEIPRDESGKPIVLPGPKQFQAAPVKILETNRDGSLTAQWLGDEEGRSTGLGLLVADIDSDGRTEVFVANDQNANHLWQRSGEGNSDGASWVETATALGCGYGTSGRGMACMGIAAADFDRNGRPDLHITNFLGERSNLYLQRPDRSFRDSAVRYGIDEVSVNLLGFGTQPIDYDNDGWFDLFVGNGHIEDFRDRGKSFRMRPQLLRNNGVAFQELVVDGDDPFWSSQRLSRGVAVLDWNRDGKVDVAVGDLSDRFALLENRTETTNACLQIELVGVAGDRNAIGTTIQSFDDDHRDVYMMTSGDGYLARNEAVVFIGRGPHPHEESSATLEIHWPGGLKQPLRGLQSGRYLVVEGSEPWKRW